MNEKTKKHLIILAYQSVLALGLFLLLFVLSRFAPQLTEKISVIWTKNTDLKKAARLFADILKELLPF